MGGWGAAAPCQEHNVPAYPVDIYIVLVFAKDVKKTLHYFAKIMEDRGGGRNISFLDLTIE